MFMYFYSRKSYKLASKFNQLKFVFILTHMDDEK